jgi:hypothetical protein
MLMPEFLFVLGAIAMLAWAALRLGEINARNSHRRDAKSWGVPQCRPCDDRRS